MRLQREDGVSARFIIWNLSCTERSFVVVALDDGSLDEWALRGCRIIEDRKTSDAVELSATDSQQLRAKIAALADGLEVAFNEHDIESFACLCIKLRQLSAMQ